MPGVEQMIVACASCGTQYNVSTMAPGAKFRCQKCSTINIVPEMEAPPPPSPPPPRPQPKPQSRLPAPPARNGPPAKPSKTSGSRIATHKPAQELKKGRLSPKVSAEGEEPETSRKKGGLLAPENQKFLYIGGAIVLVLLAAFYVMHSRSVAEKNKQLTEQAAKEIKEINNLVGIKDFAMALEKSEAFIKEFNDCELPEIKKNVDNTKTSIKGIEQSIERQKEGTAKLKELLDKKSDATPEQYEDLVKEFGKLTSKYAEFGQIFEKASSAVKDLEAKIAAKQEEDDNRIYSELLAEIKPMVDQGKIDSAITHLKKYWDGNSPSKRLQGALKKKLSELKALK